MYKKSTSFQKVCELTHSPKHFFSALAGTALLTLGASFLLVGCTSEKPESSSPSEEKKEPESNNVLTDYVKDPLDKAKGLSDKMDKKNEELNEMFEETR